jgi:UDP-N-acetylmuramoylalanine--D-glutamate ligase
MPSGDLHSVSDVQDAVVTVMGLGRFKQGSGVGAAKWLLRHGAQIVVTDLKSEKDLKESVDLVTEWYEKYRAEYPDRAIYAPVFRLGQHQEEDFVNVQLVVKNPDVPKESAYVQTAEKAGVRVESDVSLFLHFYPHPAIAVTGTRGKSTTTALIGEMLKGVNPKTVVAGNIMHSPLEELDWMLEEKQPVPVALEMSSWLLESLGHMSRGFDISVLTNVSEDHLDRYASFESYIAAKELVFRNQTTEQKAVLNYDHPIVRTVGDRVKSERFWFSKQPLPIGINGTYIDPMGDLYVRIGEEQRKFCHVSEWPALQGEHNVENALAATLVAVLSGVPDAHICETLRTFEGLPGRQQTVREFDSVTYVNDTNATSPEGTMAALKRFGDAGKKHIVLIVGGKGKGSKFDDMAKMVREYCKHVVYLEGTATDEIEQLIGNEIQASYAASMDEAVKAGRATAKPGDIVLMSPATASFGMFKNAYDRGGQFVEAVKNLT